MVIRTVGGECSNALTFRESVLVATVMRFLLCAHLCPLAALQARRLQTLTFSPPCATKICTGSGCRTLACAASNQSVSSCSGLVSASMAQPTYATSVVMPKTPSMTSAQKSPPLGRHPRFSHRRLLIVPLGGRKTLMQKVHAGFRPLVDLREKAFAVELTKLLDVIFNDAVVMAHAR